jgi:hypothetical protein
VSLYDAEFWHECDKYHDLARRYERGVSIDHPNAITLRGYTSGWYASRIIYYNEPCFEGLK